LRRLSNGSTACFAAAVVGYTLADRGAGAQRHRTSD
jgi:hypothetical protein